MRLFLVLLLMFFSSNSNAVGLQDFQKYKTNNALLESDIARLEEIVLSDHSQLYKETLDQYKYLLSKYDVLNSPLSLLKFSEDVAATGWSNVRRIARNLSTLCEVGRVDIVACKKGLDRLRTFVTNSNLDGASKESIISFLEDYTIELNVIATFDDAFVGRFNLNTQAVNERKFSLNPAPPIVVTVKPVDNQIIEDAPINSNQVKVEKIKKIISSESPPIKTGIDINESILNLNEAVEDQVMTLLESAMSVSSRELMLFLGSLGLFMISLLIVRFGRKRRQMKSFQRKVFKIAKKNKMKIKIIGKSDFFVLGQAQIIEKGILESILHSKIVSDTAYIKFKTQKNILSIEMLFSSKKSIQNVINQESLILEKKIENLKSAVEADAGELSFVNKFNHKGEITQTSFVISLPL